MSTSLVATPSFTRVAVRPPRFRLDRGEWTLLILFALVSVWVLGLDLYQVIAHGRAWTGTDGPYSTDQLQYLAWIQSASQHFLVSNMFVLHGTPADYFQPAVAVSGLLVAAGMAPWLSLLLWKPVAVLALFFAVRAFARRALPEEGRGAWLAVLALTLFYGSFTILYGSFGVLGDLFPGFMAWGYPFALMALAAILAALISYDAARRAGRVTLSPALLGLLAGLLHPWQGELLVGVLVLLELFSPETRGALTRVRSLRSLAAELATPRVRLAALSIAGALIPLLYYAALDKLDMSWGLGRTASKHAMPVTSILLVVAPLALVALTGYRGPARNVLVRACRVWPVATLAFFLQSGSSAGATPLHTVFGITLPLSVLAVHGCLRLGWRRLRHGRALAVLLILVFTVPTTVWELKEARTLASPTPGNANFITRDEQAALSYLRRDPVRGGVLTRFYLGAAVPARTGRRTYIGDCIWSEPNCQGRQQRASLVLKSQLTPARTRQVVLATHARFLLTDCGIHAVRHGRDPLAQRLGGLLVSVRRFGCASVYQVR